MSYVLITKECKSYFVDPSYQGWGLTKDLEKATTFDTREEADKVCEAVERAVCSTYWDYSDIEPFPEVVEL